MTSTVYLKDYQPYTHAVEQVHLHFRLEAESTLVTAKVQYRRTAQGADKLCLDGEHLELVDIRLNHQPLQADDYHCHERGLDIFHTPEKFTLDITTRINPQANQALEGLYRSGGNYCTQCEAEGFRRITYYPDRPDVMSEFFVRIEAEKAANPVLLANGNPIASGKLADGWHFAEWHDPFAKPCYLFALVAGDLSMVEDTFTTMSGRTVTLRIFTEAHHIHQCDHAMASLKRAMRWDEERFGREYDLDLFMIVAVDDFNMGAMENKGLNIFNSRLVFASPETATDDDYLAIEAVIAHEYFHNWTGNRVTCRDWFQLSLKEGLTVFRDQSFTADTHDATVKRIEDVRLLRTHQFTEDASPMAHPIRPSSYMEINNFYTVTVYEKGAEVVRMYQTLLGVDGFRKGMDLYFQRHDGQAVTTEDFLQAMSDANGVDLSQMQRWYDQAGTPTLSVHLEYDETTQQCTLHCRQSCPPTPEQQHKEPFLIPFKLALLSPDGHALPLQLKGETKTQGTERILHIREQEQCFVFIHIPVRPIPSLLRDFSAPVNLQDELSHADLSVLMQYDDNAFNRWNAGQRLSMRILLDGLRGEALDTASLLPAFHSILNDKALAPALKAEALSLPSEQDIIEASRPAHPERIHTLREQLRQTIADALYDDFKRTYHDAHAVQGMRDQAIQQRKLKHVCLAYMLCSQTGEATHLAYQQFHHAEHMTDQYAALAQLAAYDIPERKMALQAFEQQWQHDTHVMDKWFSVQACAPLADTLTQVQQLMQHSAFHLSNPNKVRALLGSFAMRNPYAFHATDGKGYAFLAEQVLALDAINPQMAARMVRPLMNWRHFEAKRSDMMRQQLQHIAQHPELSGDVFEIVSKSL